MWNATTAAISLRLFLLPRSLGSRDFRSELENEASRARARARPPRIRTLVSLKSLDREKRLLHGFWHLRAHPPRRAARQPRALLFLPPPPLAMFKLNKVSTVPFPLAIEYIEIPSSTEEASKSVTPEKRNARVICRSIADRARQSR
jgi:hypothetical protein